MRRAIPRDIKRRERLQRRLLLKKEKMFLAAQYFLNHKLDPEEVRRQVKEFADKGYQGVFAHARPGLLTPYMSSDWWNIIDVIM